MEPSEIKALRLARGETQEKLAKVLGTSWVTISRWENGKSKPAPYYMTRLTELRDKKPKGARLSRNQEN